MTAGTEMRIRVCVTDVWDTVPLAVAPEWTVGRIKAEALRQATGRARLDPERYIVKYRGARVLDEQRTLAELGVPDGAAFIVLPASRQPVR